MIPKFLKKFETELKKYKREFVKINAKSLNISAFEDQLDIKTSKFLGFPFYPKSKIYPTDKNGKPMLMAAQINFEEIPQLLNFPENGILQLFLSGANWYEEESKIVYHTKSETESEFLEDFSFINQEDYEYMPILFVHELSFEMSIENAGLTDNQFKFQFGDQDWYEFIDQLSENEQSEFYDYFDASGHKLGGYAEFTQDDPRDYGTRNEDDIQLIQIDSDENIIFGDVGIGHVFISIESLKTKNFERAYFTWDCQ